MSPLVVTLLVIVSFPGEPTKKVETELVGMGGVQGCAMRMLDILSAADVQIPPGATTEVRCKVERKPLPSH